MIPLARPSLGEAEVRAVAATLRSGWVSGTGPVVARFESEFSRRLHVPHARAVSSGTAALHLALLALGIGPGDDVIVPSLTFVATANAVRFVGARPVFADVQPDEWTLDPNDVERRLTRRAKAVVPVHFAGLPADMDPLRALASDARAVVLEDAAQAIGSRYHGHPVGAIGDAAAFSFHALKVMTTGEGGMITARRASVADRVASLRDQAKSSALRYRHSAIGFNYRLSSLQAALGLTQLRRLGALSRRRLEIARRYRQALPQAGFQCQAVPRGRLHCYSFFGVLARTRSRRERLLTDLRRRGIESRPFFDPLHRNVPHRSSVRLPVTDEVAGRGLFIPCGPSLSENDVARVIAALVDLGA